MFPNSMKDLVLFPNFILMNLLLPMFAVNYFIFRLELTSDISLKPYACANCHLHHPIIKIPLRSWRAWRESSVLPAPLHHRRDFSIASLLRNDGIGRHNENLEFALQSRCALCVLGESILFLGSIALSTRFLSRFAPSK